MCSSWDWFSYYGVFRIWYVFFVSLLSFGVVFYCVYCYFYSFSFFLCCSSHVSSSFVPLQSPMKSWPGTLPAASNRLVQGGWSLNMQSQCIEKSLMGPRQCLHSGRGVEYCAMTLKDRQSGNSKSKYNSPDSCPSMSESPWSVCGCTLSFCLRAELVRQDSKLMSCKHVTNLDLLVANDKQEP